jgi:hypothetical protein
MIAAPAFYAERLGAPYVEFTAALELLVPGPLARLAATRPRLRGLILGLLARRGHLSLLAIRGEPGTMVALGLCALPPARARVFVCELLLRPSSPAPWRRALRGAWSRFVERPALRRGMAGGQVMTAWERDSYVSDYGLDPARLHLVRWPLREGGETPMATIDPSSRAVFSSGRTACDWPTLFAAARGAGWELTVVCSTADAAAVRALAAEADDARVEVELPWAEHDRLLRAGAVCAIVLADRGISAGQVRLMSAVEAGVPVVASASRALDEYVVAGETAVVVPAADPGALRAAVDALLEDPQLREQLREQARAHAGAWTYVQYFDQLRQVVEKVLAASDERLAFDSE